MPGFTPVAPWLCYILLCWSPFDPRTGLRTQPEASLLFLSDPSTYLRKDKMCVTVFLPGIARDLSPFSLPQNLSCAFPAPFSSIPDPILDLQQIFFPLSRISTLLFLWRVPQNGSVSKSQSLWHKVTVDLEAGFPSTLTT